MCYPNVYGRISLLNFLVTILVLISAFAALPAARADEALSSREYMTGDWGGARGRLADWGLGVTAEYSASVGVLGFGMEPERTRDWQLLYSGRGF